VSPDTPTILMIWDSISSHVPMGVFPVFDRASPIHTLDPGNAFLDTVYTTMDAKPFIAQTVSGNTGSFCFMKGTSQMAPMAGFPRRA